MVKSSHLNVLAHKDVLSIADIINQELVTTYYQPIVNLKTGEIIAYEALSRGPVRSSLYSPLALIEAAKAANRSWELELLFRKKALSRIAELHTEQCLFLNVDAQVIATSEYESGLTKSLIEEYGVTQNRVIMEITERTAIKDYQFFVSVLNNYRSQGYRIAIDDVGAGYSGLVTINEIKPDYIKIDMELIRNIDKDAYKQALIKAFVDTSATTNIKVIAEGIETEEELKALIMLGVHGGQGYYLSKPSESISGIDEQIKKQIEKYNQISRNINDYSQEYHYISNLVRTDNHLVFEPMIQSGSVKKIIQESTYRSACICEYDRPVGLVMQDKINASLSTQFGYSLYSAQPIGKIMDKHPLVVDAYMPINTVAKNAMGRSDDNLYDDIVVTKGGRFYGLVPMKKIFEYALMYEKSNAKDRNPLTGLPGNPVINRVLKDLINYQTNFCVLYIDVNEFKVYNDVYGFEKGDEMIVYLANMLGKIVKKRYPYTGFLGHIGGDDFIIAIDAEHDKIKKLCQLIIDTFEVNKRQFFNRDHYDRGTIISEDRFGIIRHLPLTSLSVAGLFGKLSIYAQTERLTEALATCKKEVKKSGFSDYKIKLISDHLPLP